jgi:hypothetical protein
MEAESTKSDGKPSIGKAALEISGLEAVPGKPAVRNSRGAMETSASFEARYAPLSYPTVEAPLRPGARSMGGSGVASGWRCVDRFVANINW